MSKPKRRWISLDSLGLPEVVMLGHYDNARAEEVLEPHAHAGCMEICYLERGRQRYVVDGRDYWLGGGDVFVTFPGEMHSSGESPQEKGTLYWLILQLPQRGGRFLGGASSASKALVSALRDLPRRKFGGQVEFKKQLDQVFTWHAAVGPPAAVAMTRLRIQTTLVQFLLGVVECAQRDAPTPWSAPIRRAESYLRQRLGEPTLLRHAAAAAGLSLPRFKARFRDEVGIPPAEYLQRCRIERAEELLSNSTRSVTEIAFELGFCSSQYFSTVFRRYTRQTPSAYRAARRLSRPALP
jgi:AraC-like DNA-binding protein